MKTNRTIVFFTVLVAALVVTTGAVAEDQAGAAATPEQSAPAAQTAPTEAVPQTTAAPQAVFNAPGSKMVSINYGYVMTDYESATTDATGWRVNGVYEMRTGESPLVQGLTVGYMQTSADREITGSPTVTYKAKTIPIYYSPKLILGKKAIKGFVKGALGGHYTNYERSGGGTGVVANDDEFGFFGGASLGAMVVLKEKFFISAEYEWIYMSNTYLQDGAVQSATLGIGMQL